MKTLSFFNSLIQNLYAKALPLLQNIARKTGGMMKRRDFWLLLASFPVAGILFISVIYILVLNHTFGHLPEKEELRNITQDEATQVFSSDYVLMGRYYIKNRVNISLDSVPRHIVNALIAIEDNRFYDHNGVDFKSLARVAIKSILLGDEASGGGSTITQQLVKNLYPRVDYRFISLPVNKAREHIISLRLEKVYTKEELLSFYLNTVSFGENTYGLETASRRFFDIHPSVLKIEEAALLMAMLKAPANYNPRTHYENSLNRRNLVLSQMAKHGYLRNGILDSLKNLPLNIKYARYTEHMGLAPYFREYLRQQTGEILKLIEEQTGKEYNLYTSGLKIYTTLDSRLQAYAESAVKEQMKELQSLLKLDYNGNFPWSEDEKLINSLIRRSDIYKLLKKKNSSEEEIKRIFSDSVHMEMFSWEGYKKMKMSRIDSIKYYLNFLHSGFLAIDPENGAVKAWVGGINFKHFKYDHVLSKRQAGSTFKPILYATAIENGFSPCKYISNDTITFSEYDNWHPRNSDRKYGGYYSIKGALTNSVNTVAARLIMETGIDSVINTAYRLGIGTELEKVPSLALGSAGVSLFELVQAYSSFVNGGRIVKPLYIQRIEDSEGNIIFRNEKVITGQKAFSEETAEKMLHMLISVINEGTASGIRSQFRLYGDLAGKTGTTQDQSDGWFVAITPEVIAGAWVGGEMPVVRFSTLKQGQGSSTAMPVIGNFFKKMYSNPEFEAWEKEKFVFSTIQNPEEIFNCPDYKEDTIRNKIFRIFDIFRRKGRSHRNNNNTP